LQTLPSLQATVLSVSTNICLTVRRGWLWEYLHAVARTPSE